MVDRLCAATNARDLEGIVGCFAVDYRNETPCIRHADLAASRCAAMAADLRLRAGCAARVVASAVNGATIWTEWEHTGTRADGSAHVMRGVIIFGVRDGLLSSAGSTEAGRRGSG